MDNLPCIKTFIGDNDGDLDFTSDALELHMIKEEQKAEKKESSWRAKKSKKKKQKAKRREKRKKEKTQEFFKDTNSSFFARFSQKKCITEKEDYERKEETREDFEKRECRRERCLLTTGARRRIEWKRNPSMKRSHRSPCWYELNMCISFRRVRVLLNVRVRGEEDEATVFLLLLRFLLLLLRINALITKFSDLFLCSQISLSVSRVIYIMVKKYRRRRLCSARASSSRS